MIGINKIFELSAEIQKFDYITVTTANIAKELRVNVILFYKFEISENLMILLSKVISYLPTMQ